MKSFILILFFSPVSFVEAETQCKALLGKNLILTAIESLAEDFYQDPLRCSPEQCFINSGQFGREIMKELPSLNIEDFKILVIRHRKANLRKIKITRKTTHLIVGRTSLSRNEKTPFWHYHAVIEYKDRVVDFSRKEGWLLRDTKKYIKQMFPVSTGSITIKGRKTLRGYLGFTDEFNLKKDLVITEVPLEDYLSRFDQNGIFIIQDPAPALSFIEDYPAYVLESYLQ